jgi:peptidoglycan glycosyltransferase
MRQNRKPKETEIPKVYTSRHKKSERVLKAIFIVSYVLLAVWILKILIMDSVEMQVNAYNPRLSAIEARFYRGRILDRAGRSLAIQEDDIREYPYGAALGPVTGYSGPSKDGLEDVMNSYLLSPASTEDQAKYWLTNEKLAGCDIDTTVNAELSYAAYQGMGDYKGAVIITEADTGELLALVSNPFYNPNSVFDNWDSLRQDEDQPFFNRATMGIYPPGSTFKLLTSLAWHRSSLYDPDYTYTCEGYEEFDGYGMRCFHGEIHGELTIADALAHSCNTFFSTLAVKIGRNSLTQIMDDMGFEQKIPFVLPTAVSEYGLDADSNLEELAATGIGQGQIEMTPLLLNRITCAIANGGWVRDYMLVEDIRNADGSIRESIEHGRREPVMTSEEAKWLTEMMKGVCDYGTADIMSYMDSQVYGKTGTAENVSETDHTWFTGFFEAGNGHRIAVTVLLEESGGQYHAVYLARDLIEWILTYGY